MTGRHQPQVIGITLSADCRSVTVRRTCSSPQSRPRSSVHSGFTGKRARRRSAQIRACPTITRDKRTATPPNQTTSANPKRPRFKCVATGAGAARVALTGGAADADEEPGRTDAFPGTSSSVNVSWFPVSRCVPTDHSGFCQAGSSTESAGRHSKPPTARNHSQWRVAAAARRQQSTTPPVVARTTKLFSSASRNTAASFECWAHSRTLALILTSILPGFLPVFHVAFGLQDAQQRPHG